MPIFLVMLSLSPRLFSDWHNLRQQEWLVLYSLTKSLISHLFIEVLSAFGSSQGKDSCCANHIRTFTLSSSNRVQDRNRQLRLSSTTTISAQVPWPRLIARLWSFWFAANIGNGRFILSAIMAPWGMPAGRSSGNDFYIWKFSPESFLQNHPRSRSEFLITHQPVVHCI